jgi:hypothetical protein
MIWNILIAISFGAVGFGFGFYTKRTAYFRKWDRRLEAEEQRRAIEWGRG